MMKNIIATITFHRALNCGAVLQSYALQKYIESLKCDSEVIDYRCPKVEEAYRIFRKTKNLRDMISVVIYFPIKIVKKYKFSKFKKTYLKQSLKCNTHEELMKLSKKYKTVIVGSDQVWNLEITGKDKAFFLDFCDKDKRVAYAASVGNNSLFLQNEKLYKDDLNKFKGISVREKSVSEKMGVLLGRKISTVVDPVFLLDREEWERMIDAKGENSPYIFSYCLHEKKVYEETQRISDRKSLPIVCVPSNFKCPIKGKIKRTMGPIEFLTMIRNAEYIVTDSFHAIAFSIIFNKKFIPVLKNDYKELNERILSLMDVCGLTDLFYQKEILFEQLNYNDVNSRLKVEIDKSKLFLKNNI